MTIGTDGIGYSFDDGIFEPVSVVLGGNAYIKQADQMIVVSRDAMRALAQTIIDESASTASSTNQPERELTRCADWYRKHGPSSTREGL